MPVIVKARMDTIKEATLEVALTHCVVSIDNIHRIVRAEDKAHLKESALSCMDVETLGDPYYKRVPLPCVPEYHNLSQDSQLTKPSVKFAAVEPTIISNYPNRYRKIFGRRRLPITPSCE